MDEFEVEFEKRDWLTRSGCKGYVLPFSRLILPFFADMKRDEASRGGCKPWI